MTWWQRQAARVRGLIALLVVVGAALALYEQTPLGPISRMAYNWARGTTYRGPSPLAAFTDAGGRSYGFLVPVDEQAVQAIEAAASCLARPQLQDIARASEVDVAGLEALIGAHARVNDAGCTLELPADLLARTVEVLPAGTTREAVRSDPQLAARGLARLLGAEQQQFRHSALAVELAVESLLIGRSAVQGAVAAATAAGLRRPESLEVHRALLPAGAANRADRALWVMARMSLNRLLWPAEGFTRITSGFGERVHPVTGRKQFHNGIDIAMPVGTLLRAILAGNVVRIGRDAISGNYLRINHGYGLESVFCHLSYATASDVAAVLRGEPVGLSGNTGRSTGPHLHFGIKMFGRDVDPMALYRGVLPPPPAAASAPAASDRPR
ncbi:MAG: M23 family metallopeptidase [Deltaproteobacteria bacterium]|nr:M23 family metallopeptidase [Deltaproteobacteria bacterium]